MNDSEPEICRFFVYGTLCRGQCREHLWPHSPLQVTPAWTRGRLYGRDDYPAMRAGSDRVAGECWEFEVAQMPDVIRVLDEIEGTDQTGPDQKPLPNLYDRVIVETHGSHPSDPPRIAFGYHYATNPESDGFVQIKPLVEGGTVRWP